MKTWGEDRVKMEPETGVIHLQAKEYRCCWLPLKAWKGGNEGFYSVSG